VGGNRSCRGGDYFPSFSFLSSAPLTVTVFDGF